LATIKTKILKTGKIRLTDKTKIAKILNRNNYLLIIVGIIFLIIDYDLFSSQPKFLITEGFFWKGIAIVFQLIFIGTLIQWEYKKQRIIDILSNGTITRGKLEMSEKIKPNHESSFYIHLFEYEVDNKKYEVTIKNKQNSVKSDFIIYQSNNPKNGIVYEDLKNELKKMVADKIITE
jgi:vacuolar-type H+-ATPase subunit I/STV1